MTRHAVFTIVQNDPVNLKIWLYYYRQFYRSLDTFVLHHPLPGQSFDDQWIVDLGAEIAGAGYGGSLDHGFMLAPGVFREESFDHTWLRETVQAFQRFLLQSYDTVLFTEVDEIVAPNPTATDMAFREWLNAFARSGDRFVRCSGYEVVHDYATEPALDFTSKPLLKQRTYWYFTWQYSKPLLSKVPLTWVNGFHMLDQHMPYDVKERERQRTANTLRNDLLLLHLHKLDFGHALKRHQESAARKWAQHDVDTNQGLQNRVAEEAWLRDWWLNTVDTPYQRVMWEKMPEAVKEIV